MKELQVIETDKTYAKINYPEVFDIDDGIPGNFQEAFDIFDDLESKPSGFYESFESGNEGWCDIFETENGKIAVYGDGELTNSMSLYIVELY